MEASWPLNSPGSDAVRRLLRALQTVGTVPYCTVAGTPAADALATSLIIVDWVAW